MTATICAASIHASTSLSRGKVGAPPSPTFDTVTGGALLLAETRATIAAGLRLGRASSPGNVVAVDVDSPALSIDGRATPFSTTMEPRETRVCLPLTN